MKHRMEDGIVVDTDAATGLWAEQRDFDGRNRYGRWSGDQWSWATLYRSKSGRYYLVTASSWQGGRDLAEWVTEDDAAAFMLANDYPVPPDLCDAGARVSD